MKTLSSIYFKIFFLFLSAIIVAILLAYEIDKSFHNSEISRSKIEIFYLINSMTPSVVMGDFATAKMLAEQFGFYGLNSLPERYTTLYQSTDDMVGYMIFSTKEMLGFALEYGEYHTIVSRPISYGVVMGNDFLFFCVVFVGILVLLGIVVLRLLRPLRKLKKSLKSFNAEISNSVFEEVTQKDEISALITMLNKMSEQIVRMLKSRELILKSLGHELKTPLTKMRLFVEVSQKKYPYMQKLLPHISSLRGLIDNILELERLNSGKIQLQSSRFFAETLVFETLKNFNEEEEKIRIEMIENFSIQGDLELLARALRNLIENALKYNESPYIKIIIGDELCAQNATAKNQKMTTNNDKNSKQTNRLGKYELHSCARARECARFYLFSCAKKCYEKHAKSTQMYLCGKQISSTCPPNTSLHRAICPR